MDTKDGKPSESAACGCTVGDRHRHACASVGYVDPPRRHPQAAELLRAAKTFRSGYVTGALDIPLAEWLEATAERVGGKTWTGSRHALRVARMINERA